MNKLNEFVRDMISFANTARRWGEPAYILFGVDDDGRVLTEGIRGQCTTDPLPMGWDDDDPLRFERQQIEIIDRQLHQCVDQYIFPPLVFDYVPGQLSDGTIVSYVEIPPNPTSSCFEVKKPSKGGKKPLRQGECLRREGESKIPVGEHEKQFLYSYRDMPYIKMAWWQKHFERLASRFEKSEWEYKPYLPLFCKRNNGRLDLLLNVVHDFLAASEPHVLLVIGKPGAGKTTFLELLAGELAEQAAVEAMTSTDSQLQRVIPAIFGLNGYTRDENNPLARRVAMQGLDRFGLLRLQRGIATPEGIFKDHTLPFVVCFDALDEMRQAEAEFQEVKDFLDNHPSMKIIVTCRTDALQRQWQTEYSVAAIELLSEDQILEYLQGRVENPREALGFFFSDEDMLELVRIPLMLEAAAEYWYDLECSINQIQAQQTEAGEAVTELPSVQTQASLGNALDWLFLSLFDHESGKSLVSGRDLDAIRHMETLSDLARYMDGTAYQVSHRELMGILKSEANVLVYRNMGILQRQRARFVFANQLVQVYFAAFGYRLLIESTEEGTEQLCEEVKPNMPFWRKCIEILEQITYRDISSVLALFES